MDTQTDVDRTGAQIFITVSDACVVAEKSERTMRRWLSSGKVKAHPGPGGQVRIDRAELLLFMSKKRPKAAIAAGAARDMPDIRQPQAPDKNTGAVMDALVAELRDRITDLTTQRDRLQDELRVVRQELTEAREARRSLERELLHQPKGLLSRAAKRFGL